nr:hypothetical protein [Tanacetum cinerariifolium]
MALPDKHQFKFNSHKDAKTLMEAIEKRFGGNTETKKLVSQLEIHGVSLFQEDVNLKFLRSLPSEWKTHTLIWRNKLDNEDLKHIDVDDLKEIDLRWQMAMLTMRARRFLQKTGRNLGANGPTSMGFDMSKVECYNCHRKRHFARECYNCHREGLSHPTKPDQDLSHTTRHTSHIIEDCVSDFEDESETKVLQIVLSFVQSSEQVKSPRHLVQPVETSILAATPKPASPKSASSGKRRNRKACFVCKSVDHLIKDYDYHAKKMAQPTPKNYAHRGNHKQYASLTHTNPQKHMVPAVVLAQSKPVYITAVPKIWVTRPRLAYPIVTKSKSPIRRHITRSPSLKTSNSPHRVTVVQAPMVSATQGNPQYALKDKGVIDSGCSRHMTGNMSYQSDFDELNGGYVAFGGNPKGGKISGKGKIKTCKSDFDDVYFVKEIKFIFFSVSQICDKRNSVLFTDTECLVLSLDFKLPDESQVLLRVPRENNMYNVNLKNIVPSGDLTCLFVKETIDESNLWHRRVPRTPQLDGIAKRKNKTLIEAARTMLADSLLPIPFWAKAVNTACYVQNRVLVTKPHNKTPYELLHGRTPSIGFMRPFGCPVTILNTLDPLEKFEGKVGEGFLVGYSVSSKAFRVFNSRTRIVQETLHVNFLENKPNVAGSGPTWLFDIDSLTRIMNYQPVNAGNQTNPRECFQDKFDAEKVGDEVDKKYVLFPVNAQSRKQDDKTKKEAKGKSLVESFTRYRDLSAEFEDCTNNNINEVNAAGNIVPTVGQNSSSSTNTFSAADMPELEDITYFDDEDDGGAEADFNNLESSITVSPISTTRVHKDHPVSQIIGDLSSTTQTRSMTRVVKDQGEPSQMFNNDFHACMFVYFLSQEEPNRVHQAFKDPSWIEAMQEELLQFKMQKVWVLVDLPHEKRAIGTKWVYRNKKDERGMVIKNKARIVAQGHTQEEGIDYEEVFAPVARIEAIRLFLAYASFMGFMVYQMDIKSAFLYGTIEKKVYVCQPPGFEDHDHPDKVYKVVKALYGLHQAPRAWCETLANYLLENSFQRGKIDQTLFIKRQKEDILLVQIYVDDIIFGATNKDLCKSFEKLMKDKFQMSFMRELTFFLGLQVKQKKDGMFISQDEYVAEILKKFGLTEGKSASTPSDTKKHLLKDPDGEDVDVHNYRSMIGSLMYLTSSRPDIMFVVCACARFQVTPKASHLHAVKRIFRYLKSMPHLGLWYPNDSPFDLVAYSNSDYAGASLDRKSTTGGCQFLGCRLIYWQCKKQIVVATSSTEVEYVAVASCCAQVLWIQNQLLDYGYNFMHTRIFIDNSSTICIIKNPVLHSKTKHIEIRHQFIRDCNEKKLIQVIKIPTENNFADLAKAFDVGRFQYLVARIGLLNS